MTMRHGNRWLIQVVASTIVGVLGGCRESTPQAPVVVVRDSAGVHIVESSQPTFPLGSWTVATEPELEIGADESKPMQNLFRVAGATALSDGRVVVANRPAPMLRWFNLAGEFLAGTGRPGGGPGEFGGGESAWISTVWPLAGDSIATWEHSARRMQVFDPEGAYSRSVILELPPNMDVGSYPQIAGRSEAGFVAFLWPEAELPPVGERERRNFIYLSYLPDGSYSGRLAVLPGFETLTLEVQLPGRPAPLRAEGRPPFAKSPSSWVHGAYFYYGSADRFEIARYELDGTLKALVRRTDALRPLTPAIRAAFIAQQTRLANSAAPRSAPSIEDMPFPDSIPPYRNVRTDRTGWLWVQNYSLPGDTTVTWSVFDPSDRWVTDVIVPRTWQILEIGLDYILALQPDDLDVERVLKFKLSRTNEPQ